MLALRRSLAALALLVYVGCGGAPAPSAVSAVEPLGVQGNSQTPTVRLRVAAAPGSSFVTASSIEITGEMMGQPVEIRMEDRTLRRVIEVRPEDGALLLEERTTSMVVDERFGSSPPRTRTEGPREPTRSWMTPRGAVTPIEDEAAASAGAGPSDVVRDRVDGMLDAFLEGLEYPEGEIRRGESWGSEGVLSLSEASPEVDGGLTYSLVQRLDHIEGSGEGRIAVIAVELVLEGAGAMSEGGEGMRLRGPLSAVGSYAVAVSDGLVRRAELRLDGEVALGELFQIPLEGRVVYQADPIR